MWEQECMVEHCCLHFLKFQRPPYSVSNSSNQWQAKEEMKQLIKDVALKVGPYALVSLVRVPFNYPVLSPPLPTMLRPLVWPPINLMLIFKLETKTFAMLSNLIYGCFLDMLSPITLFSNWTISCRLQSKITNAHDCLWLREPTIWHSEAAERYTLLIPMICKLHY